MSQRKKTGQNFLSVCFWLLCWELLYRTIHQEILLVSPWVVAQTLGGLVLKKEFWASIAFSFGRIFAGFALGLLAGCLLGALAWRFSPVKVLLAPAVTALKAVPVASFVILALCWVSSRNLSVFIAFVMVFPIFYLNLLGGFSALDQKLLEMARVFRLPLGRRVRFIYLPQLASHFFSACTLSLGLCWKAGVAAEVIGLPDGSIGEKLYQAKIFFNTPELFAWTVVILVISLVFEKLFLRLAKSAQKALEGRQAGCP